MIKLPHVVNNLNETSHHFELSTFKTMESLIIINIFIIVGTQTTWVSLNHQSFVKVQSVEQHCQLQ